MNKQKLQKTQPEHKNITIFKAFLQVVCPIFHFYSNFFSTGTATGRCCGKQRPVNLSKKGYRFVKIHENNLVNWNALRPRGPFLFRRPEKEAKGAVLHGTSAAERLRHVETRSAGRTKTRCLTALKQFVRPFFHRAKRDEKIP
ncbi:MAG: hypothetical protein KIC46_09310, partial [Clostridiales bacterium]|nr:hypothetical protein [Clostridiales bacterium]